MIWVWMVWGLKVWVIKALQSQRPWKGVTECFDAKSGDWKIVYTMPRASWGAVACAVKNGIYIYGGWGDDGHFIGHIRYYAFTIDMLGIILLFKGVYTPFFDHELVGSGILLYRGTYPPTTQSMRGTLG